MQLLKIKYFVILLITIPYTTFSQNAQYDYTLTCDSALLLYKQEMHNKKDYIIGVEYKIYHNYKQDNPYLQSHQGKGTIFSKGYTYDNKIILYDMFKDIIAVNSCLKSSTNINIQLQKVHIDSFLIEFNDLKYLFKHIKNNKTGQNQIHNGFYEIPYTGKFQLLYKYIAKKGQSEGITTYTHQIKKILNINNTYYDINKKQKFLELFSFKKKQIKKKIRSLKMSYRELTTSHLIELIKFAETL